MALLIINLIFASRELTAVLAHVGTHCVTGIVLPPVDATSIVSLALQREDEGRQKIEMVNCRNEEKWRASGVRLWIYSVNAFQSWW